MFVELIKLDFTNHKETVNLAKDVIVLMADVLSFEKLNYKCDILILTEVLKKTQEDLKSMAVDMKGRTPNYYKQYAVFSYWLKRLKPFNERRTDFENYTNEYIALTFAIVRINRLVEENKKKNTIPIEFLKNALYIIRFEQISKYGMLMFLTAMFEV